MKYRSKILLLLLSVLFVAACSKKAVYINESFSNDSPFKLRVDGGVDLACESARRSLLGQGYLIDLANSDAVKARKATRGENAFIEMNIVCVPENSGSTIFATGVVSTYDLKKNSSSASVGLSAFGSISLPIGQSVDSLVKVSEETIDDKDFYKRFFTAVGILLGEMEAGQIPIEAEVELAVEPVAEESAPPVQSAIWPELFPQQLEPAVVPDPIPVQSEFESVPTAVMMPEPVVHLVPLAPALDEKSLGNPSSSLADEDPLGISPVLTPEDEPLGISPAPAFIEEPLGIQPQSRAIELAPIVTTAVKKVVPRPTATTPASELENIF
tara:strand:+ start:16248 stop:17228 length:981 start_codon:yes stop_codon:yes gene_type:complete